MAKVRARDAIETLSAPAAAWFWMLFVAAYQFYLGVATLTTDLALAPSLGWLFLVVGCVLTAAAWDLGTRRAYVTPDSVVVRGVRRRTIAWVDVQSIDVRRRLWVLDKVVAITPTVGKPVTARVKTGWLDDGFERDLRLLEQRWRHSVGAPAEH